MRLTEAEIDLVRASFRQVARSAGTTAATFYDRLFAIAPELRPMFPADLEEQGTKLMSMLGAIVAQLHDSAELVPMVADLGRRHAGYGARPDHYEHVNAALVWTLSKGLGEGLRPEVEAAWTKAFSGLARIMIDAAESRPAAAG